MQRCALAPNRHLWPFIERARAKGATVLGTGEPAWRQMGISAVFAVVLLVTGLRYFARVESATVDSL